MDSNSFSSVENSSVEMPQAPAIFKSMDPMSLGLPDQVRDLLEENRQLREETQRLKIDLARMERVEREVMTLVKAKSPDKIVHDLRNVLNELVLLQAILHQDEDSK